ncbi:MAG: hypothetical protein LBC70_04170 [Chitinispirillales bacterium]|jgi:hypothetical protein|nr:hypothetical protein [Chitinispirillales bacterium]
MSEYIREVKKFEQFSIRYSLDNGTMGPVRKEYKHLISNIPADIGFRYYEDCSEKGALTRSYVFVVKDTATPKIAEIQVDFIEEYEENGVKKYKVVETHTTKIKIVE